MNEFFIEFGLLFFGLFFLLNVFPRAMKEAVKNESRQKQMFRMRLMAKYPKTFFGRMKDYWQDCADINAVFSRAPWGYYREYQAELQYGQRLRG